MIQNILDFWELSSGAPERPMQAVSTLQVFDTLRVQFSSALNADGDGDDGVALRFTARACLVLAHEPWLVRILQNLIANALAHADAHRVLVTARQIQGVVYIGVHDNGKGLPSQQSNASPELLPVGAIGHPAKPGALHTVSKSYGFGSLIAQRHARNMGSELRVSSMAGRGTRFLLALPSATEPAVPNSAAPIDALIRPSGPSGAQRLALHVLVLSDNTTLNSALLPMLQTLCSIVTLRSVTEFMMYGVDASATSSTAVQVVIVEDQSSYLSATAAELTQLVRSELGAHLHAVWITSPDVSTVLQSTLPKGTQVLHRPLVAAQLAQALQAVDSALKTPQTA